MFNCLMENTNETAMNRRSFLSAATVAGLAPLAASTPRAAAQAKGLHLKITGLKTFIVNVGSVNWVFCKVTTDQGLIGLGEGSITSKEATLAQAIMEHERFLIGKDPTEIELLWQGMFRYPRWRGGPILNSAISAVEIALWDILGQALGTPIYKLLGGAARKRIRLYKDVASTPEAFLQAKAEGYTAAKSGFITVENDLVLPSFAVREGARKLEAVRKAVGDDFDICIDAHGKLTTVMAIDFCTRIEELRPFFVEEATQLEDLGELELLRQKTKVPLATGRALLYQVRLHRVLRASSGELRPAGRLSCRRHPRDEEDRHHSRGFPPRDGSAQPAERREHHGLASCGRDHARLHNSGIQSQPSRLGPGSVSWRRGANQGRLRRPA